MWWVQAPVPARLWQQPQGCGAHSLPRQGIESRLLASKRRQRFTRAFGFWKQFLCYFLLKSHSYTCNRAPKREPLHLLWAFQRAWRDACVDRLHPQGGMRFPKASSGGSAPAECKDHGVFILISEEIKKKNLGINVKQVFLLLFLSWHRKLR